MYNNNGIEITLFSLLLFCVLTIIIISIINYSYPHYPNNQHYSTLLYIQAQLDNNGNNNKDEEDKKEKKEDKDDTKTKEKDEKKNQKELEKKDKQEKEEEEYNNNFWTRADKDLITKYNYRNLAIPKIYPNAPDGETYRFNKTNPNDTNNYTNKNFFEYFESWM